MVKYNPNPVSSRDRGYQESNFRKVCSNNPNPIFFVTSYWDVMDQGDQEIGVSGTSFMRV
jgi:hypothetical protein